MSRTTSDFDWNLLRTFRAVARAGGVSAAARVLCREQPSVSAALKRLEEHFGLALCERSSRGITLTAAGQTMLDACDCIDGALASVIDELARIKGEAEALLTVQMISDVISPSFDQALVAFHRAFPRVNVKIEIAPWRQVINAVRDCTAAIGITCDRTPSDELSYRPLLYEVQQLYCGACHPLYGVPPAAPETFSGEMFVSTGEDEPEELFQFRTGHGLGQRCCGTADTLHEARKLIKMGFGVGFLPTAFAEKDDALWPLLPDITLPRYPLYVVTGKSTRLPPQTRRLVSAFLSEIEFQS